MLLFQFLGRTTSEGENWRPECQGPNSTNINCHNSSEVSPSAGGVGGVTMFHIVYTGDQFWEEICK